MKGAIKKMLKTPMVIVFIFIVLIYTLAALGAPAEINRYAIVTAIGIDTSDEEDDMFEVSLLTFVPIAEQTFTETYKVVTATGRNLSEAMDFAGLHMGRQVGLSHVKLIILNTDLIKDDVTKFLDYLSRSKHMSSSTKLIATDSSAKEFLNAAKKLDSESSIKVSELVTFNNEYIYATDSSFETFFKGMFGPTKVSFVPFLTINKKQNDGVVVAVTDQTKGEDSKSGGDSSEKDKEEIVNDGETIIFKDGKSVIKLSPFDMKKVNLIRGNFNTGSIEIDNFTDKNFTEANLTFDISNKKIRYKIVFENGIPIINIDMELNLMLAEMENKDGMIEENVEFFIITNEAINAIEKKVRNSIADAIEIMRDNQLDMADFYTILHNSNKKAFNNFLDNLEDKENYLNHVVFKIGVKVYSK